MKFILLLLIGLNASALQVPELTLSESLNEKKLGNTFLRLIWSKGNVVKDIETQIYLKKLGQELTTYSNNPNKRFDFFILNNDHVNAFAAPYGYIGVHTGLLLDTESEAELAGVLSHEITHVTQNHLSRFKQKTGKQSYVLLAGLLAAILTKNAEVSQAIGASTVAAVTQQSINFTREHEWEADRIGLKMLSKSGFDPQGMADFFKKLKDNGNAQEFLRTHPLSINRVADSLQRVERTDGNYRDDSFTYKTIRAKIYYQKHKRIELTKDPELALYMNAYQAFEKQKYSQAKAHIDKLLTKNTSNPTTILAGRVYAKLLDMDKAKMYFSKHPENQANVYYLAQGYADNQQVEKAVQVLKRYLRNNPNDYQIHQLLSLLYVRIGKIDRAHTHSAKVLVLKGDLAAAVKRYQLAKSTTHSQDVFDVLTAKIEQLQALLDLYDLPN